MTSVIKRIYKKKNVKAIDENREKIVIFDFLDQSNLCSIFRRYVNLNMSAICSTYCTAACRKKITFVEELFLKSDLIQSPYFLIYGCFVHGYIENKSIVNSESERKRLKEYYTQFYKILSQSNVVPTTERCSCERLTWIPKFFYDHNLLKWQPKPFYMCQSHNNVHYCIQSKDPCNRCFNCCLYKKPCIFQCHYLRSNKKECMHTCTISNFTFPFSGEDTTDINEDRMTAYNNANGSSAMFTSKNKSAIEVLESENDLCNFLNYKLLAILSSNLDRWIALKNINPYSQPLTVQSHFASYMNEYLYVGINTDTIEKKYFYPGFVNFITILKRINKENYTSIEWVPDFKDQVIELWKIIFFYFPYFIDNQYCFALVCFIHSERGFCCNNFETLPLNERYYPLLCHLVNLKSPLETKSNHMSKYKFEFCVRMKKLSIENQRHLLESIVEKKIALFNYNQFNFKRINDEE